MKHPSTTPLAEWSPGWLRLETMSIMTEKGRDTIEAFDEACKMSPEQMRQFVAKERGWDLPEGAA